MKKEHDYLLYGILIGVLVTSGVTWILHRSEGWVASNNQTVLKLGHGLDSTHPVHQGMEYMKKRLEELSDGTVTIEIHPSGALGSEVECIEQLQKGTLAMTKVSAASLENVIPEMAVFGLPYLFKTEIQYWDFLNNSNGKELLQKGNTKFLKGLCYYDAGSRSFYTKNHPIRKPEDLEGLKIRVMDSQPAITMVELLGATPVPIEWNQVYSSLVQGRVDGAENNPPSFTSNMHYKVCKHYTLDTHTRIPDVLMISMKVWETLPPQTKRWILQASDASSKYQRELWKDEIVKSLSKATTEGVALYPISDRNLFEAKVKPMYDAIEDQTIKELVARIRGFDP